MTALGSRSEAKQSHCHTNTLSLADQHRSSVIADVPSSSDDNDETFAVLIFLLLLLPFLSLALSVCNKAWD